MTCAKHLAMAEANERGRLVRAYFVRAEEEWRTGAARPTFAKVDPKLDVAKERERRLVLRERRLLAKELRELASEHAQDGFGDAARIIRSEAVETLTGKSIPALLLARTEPRFLSPEAISEAVSGDGGRAAKAMLEATVDAATAALAELEPLLGRLSARAGEEGDG